MRAAEPRESTEKDSGAGSEWSEATEDCGSWSTGQDWSPKGARGEKAPELRALVHCGLPCISLLLGAARGRAAPERVASTTSGRCTALVAQPPRCCCAALANSTVCECDKPSSTAPAAAPAAAAAAGIIVMTRGSSNSACFASACERLEE